MSRKYLLGINNDNEIVFGEFGITTRNGYNEFTASFNTVAPFEVEESDGIEYMESLLEDCYDNAQKYELCEQFDCTPSELAERMAENEYISTNADEKDCSIYSNRIYVDGIEYAFESISCGQHDIRDEGIKEYTNKAAVETLLDLWDNYHLKKVDDNIVEKVAQLQTELELDCVEEENKIAGYIKKYL